MRKSECLISSRSSYQNIPERQFLQLPAASPRSPMGTMQQHLPSQHSKSRKWATVAGLAAALGLTLAGIEPARANLSSEFVNPPEASRPWVYWFWLNGNLTREGITADLEAMKRVGIGGVLIMEVNQGAPAGRADFGKAEWRELFKFMLAEAGRLGLKVNMNNDAGWCGSGGPWITPELSMQRVVWTETNVEGGAPCKAKLSQPRTVANYYQDIALLAVPMPSRDNLKIADWSPTASCSTGDPAAANVLDGNPKTAMELPLPDKKQPQWVQVEFARPFTARGVEIAGPHGKWEGELQSSEDGKSFEKVCALNAQSMSSDFPEVTSRWFRVLFVHADAKTAKLSVSEVKLSAAFRIADIPGKSSAVPRFLAPQPAKFPEAPEGVAISRSATIDLTGKMDKEGNVSWDAPKGKWVLLRFGHTSTGKDNHPAPEPGRGLECDKFSKAAAETHFNGLMGKVIADSPALSGEAKTLVATHIDSWEVGSQNWTPLMREEFKKRRGYDLMPFLPAFTGRVVESTAVTERFLWDLRQTVSDMIVENYAGEFRKLAHQHGMRLSIEAYDGAPVDEMTYAGQADEPMSEFWSWGKFGAAYSCTEMASAAHIYGRRILGAEAFTATNSEKWLGHPANIKDLGDWAFCEGVNRFVFHRYAMQPWVNRAPGMSMGPWGLHYERTQTWWEQSKAWHEYLARCQHLLQQGLFVADVCYLQPEGAPRRFEPPASASIAPHIRGGYNFDGCTPEVVLTRMSVKDERLVLPDGMSYRALVLPPVETMTPALLRKVRELANAGATVIASSRPSKAPGLTNYPKCDEEVAALVAELWDSGKVITAKTVDQVFAERSLPPDFKASLPMRYIHRSSGNTEIYFVANPNPSYVNVAATFRVSGKQPELWYPDSGRISNAAAYREENDRTTIPLSLEPSGSVFVVFDSERLGDPVVSIKRDGAPFATDAAPDVSIVIQKALYGVLEDPKRTRDVTAKLQSLLKGEQRIEVKQLAVGDDPAFGTVKTLAVEYTANGQSLKQTGTDRDSISFGVSTRDESAIDLFRSGDGRLFMETGRPGHYEMTTAKKAMLSCVIPQLPKPAELTGPWQVRFAAGGGAPAEVTLDRLISWSDHSDPGVKYFSGTATYTRKFKAGSTGADIRTILDLGKVQVMAEVTVNGMPLGVLWKEPFRVDITDAVKRDGENVIEVKVVNLWVNRMIGDEQLPALPERQANGTLKAWPQWITENKPDPTGRHSFSSWNLWAKSAPLVESGLIGPVKLDYTARQGVQQDKGRPVCD